MDIFKQNRYLILVVVFLVILNLTTLTMMWFGRPQRPALYEEMHRPEQEQEQIHRLLKDELGFDDKQAAQYLRLRREHRDRVQELGKDIHRIKKIMFDEVLKDDPKPTLSDSLLKLTQEKQAQIEQLTFKHFLDIKKLCKPEQRDKLKLLMHELFRKRQPDIENDRFPPPPDRKPPRRRPGNL